MPDRNRVGLCGLRYSEIVYSRPCVGCGVAMFAKHNMLTILFPTLRTSCLALALWLCTDVTAQQPDAVMDSAAMMVDTVDAAASHNKERSAKRMRGVAWAHGGLYAGSMLLLNQAWYADYKRTSFHTFNDWPEWQQVDKIGHTWSAYQLSRASAATWQWAGATPRQQVWLGAVSGFTFLTVIETLDAFSEKWGWSWGDFAANVAGSGLFAAQQWAWQEQRIGLKFSFHRVSYPDAITTERADELYGASLTERMLKDYNGQTYWLSANLKSFMPQSRVPGWLNMAVGMRGDGMLGGRNNEWVGENGVGYNYEAIPRSRVFYLSPDIDFTKLPAKKRWVKTVFFCLNAFKVPAPALVFRKNRMYVQGLYF